MLSSSYPARCVFPRISQLSTSQPLQASLLSRCSKKYLFVTAERSNQRGWTEADMTPVIPTNVARSALALALEGVGRLQMGKKNRIRRWRWCWNNGKLRACKTSKMTHRSKFGTGSKYTVAFQIKVCSFKAEHE
jgi:hypothetical protein